MRDDGADRPDRSTDVIPVVPPGSVEGFRFAAVFDATTADGTPVVSPERVATLPPRQYDAALRYLEAGAWVIRSTAQVVDHLDAERGFAVPGGYRTDGLWIWPEAVPYYLREHRIPPQTQLSNRIIELGYRCPPVPAVTVQRAVTALTARARLIDEQAAPCLRQEPPALAMESRFPPDVTAVLVRYGWKPDRDVYGQVAAWLDELVENQPWLAEDRPEAMTVARRVLAEFGGLSLPMHGRGQETGRIPVEFHPGPELPDTYAYEHLDERVGAALFPLGTLDDGRFDLVVDGTGRVYLTGDIDGYLGASIDEALVRLIRGLAAGPVGEAPG